jgi:hypothetical protein
MKLAGKLKPRERTSNDLLAKKGVLVFKCLAVLSRVLAAFGTIVSQPLYRTFEHIYQKWRRTVP